MQPTSEFCPYCGKRYDTIEVPSLGGEGTVILGHKICHCADAEKERIKRLQEENERVERERKKKRIKAYRKAGIKPRFIDAKSDMAKDVFGLVKQGIGAYIVGNVGTGKTYLASAVARLAIDDGMSTRVTDTLDILASLKATFGTDESEDDVLSRLSRCKLLVIDDLGKETPTDWVLSQVFRIVNDRYEQMRPVIVTTQFSRPEMIERLAKNGDEETAVAIVSRLFEMCELISLTGQDKRISNAH